MTIFIFIIILGILVLSHEFGHFIAARLAGMRVIEFGFGFPPRLLSYKWGETRYSINAIPFGGFVKIFGEDPDEKEVDKSGKKFTDKSKKAQAIVIIAGILANLLLAWMLFTAGFIIGFPVPATDKNFSSLKDINLFITNVYPDSPASNSGLKIGDAITGLESMNEKNIPIRPTDVQDFVLRHESNSINVNYIRSGEKGVISVIPQDGIIDNKRAIGISTETVGLLKLSPISSLTTGFVRTAEVTYLVGAAFADLVIDAISGRGDVDSLSGPVGIYTLVGDASELGLSYLIGLTALISISLAIINLVPFPALDGGRLLFLAIEAIKGSPIKAKVANTANVLGFGILIILMLLVTYSDLVKFGFLGG